jgi:hypothetical protein
LLFGYKGLMFTYLRLAKQNKLFTRFVTLLNVLCFKYFRNFAKRNKTPYSQSCAATRPRNYVYWGDVFLNNDPPHSTTHQYNETSVVD